jgi:hypothetical protein
MGKSNRKKSVKMPHLVSAEGGIVLLSNTGKCIPRYDTMKEWYESRIDYVDATKVWDIGCKIQ